MAAMNPPLPEEDQDLTSFRNKLTAVSGSDPSVVELRVKHQDAAMTTYIANTWAKIFVGQVNELYNVSAQDARFFEDQLADADTVLTKAEQALIEFQSRNQTNVLNARVSAHRQQLSNYLASKNTIELVIQDAKDESGEVRLASHAAVPTEPVSPRKKLNTAVAGALGLFVGVFGAFAVEYWRQEKPVAQPPEGA